MAEMEQKKPNVSSGWRKKALQRRFSHCECGRIPVDDPNHQLAFEIVNEACPHTLPCGSMLGALPGRDLESTAFSYGLDREYFRLLVLSLRRSGIITEVPGILTKAKSRIYGLPARFGSLEAYHFSSNDHILYVHKQGPRDPGEPTLVTELYFKGGLEKEYSSRELRVSKFDGECFELQCLGIHDASCLVARFGHRRCRQVRNWAIRKVGYGRARELFMKILSNPRGRFPPLYKQERSIY